jgi:hypothetical protein
MPAGRFHQIQFAFRPTLRIHATAPIPVFIHHAGAQPAARDTILVSLQHKNIVHEAVKLKDNVLIFVHSIPTLSSKVHPDNNSRFPPRPSCQHTSSRTEPILVFLQVRSFRPHAELSQLGVKNKSNGPVNDSRFPPTHPHAGEPSPRSLPFFDFMVACQLKRSLGSSKI